MSCVQLSSLPRRARQVLVLWLLACSCVHVASRPASAQQAEQPPRRLVREVYVPFDELNVLLEGSPERMFLSREQYEELLKQAAQQPAALAPVSVAVLGAEYAVEMQDGRARLRGNVQLEVLQPGLHAVPLSMAGVGLLSATLDGQPAALGRGPDSHVMLFVRGQGVHALQLEFTAPVQTTAAQQTLQVQLPAAATSRLNLVVPGNVELKSGAHVVSRVVDDAQGQTRFELLVPQGPWDLVMSLNNRILRRDRVMVARSVILDEVSQAVERLHATSTFSILHGATEQLAFLLPADFEITEVASEQLSRWELAEPQDGRRRLTIHLRAPSTEPVTIRFLGERLTRDDANWTFPLIEAQDTEGSVSVLGLLVEDRLQVQRVQATGLIPIDRSILGRLPSETLAAEPGSASVRPVVAYYAPQGSYTLGAQFEKPPAKLDVLTSLLLRLDNKSLEIAGIFSLRPKIERVFSLTFLAPQGWKVNSVSDAQGNQLAFEAFAAEAGATRIQVKLAQGLAPGEVLAVLFSASGEVAGWVDDWQQKNLAFPVFRLENSDQDSGALAVLAFDDLAVRPQTLTQLSPLNNDEREQYGLQQEADLAFRYDAPGYAAEFLVERKQSNLTATTYSYLTVTQEGLRARYEAVFAVREATTRKLRVSLPESTPAEVSITGLNGTVVREWQATVEEGRRIWEILLSENVPLDENRIGSAHIALDLQSQLDQEPKDLALALLSAEGVTYQSGFVAVEGDAELEIAVKTEARRVDVGELAATQYQPGRRLLGSYGYVGAPPAIAVDVFRRQAHGLPAALVQKADLRTVFSTSGQSQTVARFELRTKALLLEARLPDAAAVLWSVVVDDVPLTPQRDGDTLLVSLPAATDREVRDLEIAYELPVSSIALWGHVESAAPRLLMPREAGEGEAASIPVADLQWQLLLPPGYEVTYSGGTLHWQPPVQRPWWQRVAGGAVAAGWSAVAPLARESARLAKTVAPSSGMAAPDASVMDGASYFENAEAFDMPAPATDAEMPGQDAGAAPPPAAGEKWSQNELSGRIDPFSADLSLKVDQTQTLDESKSMDWDLAGVRSLRVDFENAFENAEESRLVQLQSLGEIPLLSIRVVNRFRLLFAACAVGLLTFACGFCLSNSSWRAKLRYLVGVVTLAVVVPALLGLGVELQEISGSAIVAAIFLLPFFVVTSLARAAWRLLGRIGGFAGRTVGLSTATLLALWLSLTAASPVSAQVPANWEELLRQLKPPPVALPADAILIPYDPVPGADPREQGSRVLVPYEKYVELWNLAHPDDPLTTARSPVDYAFGAARFSATLANGEYLEVVGQVELESFVDRAIAVPLPFSGGVLVKSLLDGAPAKVQVVAQESQGSVPPGGQPNDAQVDQQTANAAPVARLEPLLLLYVEGKGRKQLELTLRLHIDRSGGWRIAKGTLPAAPATTLSLEVAEANTEVRLSGVADRAAYDSESAGTRIETSLADQGRVTVQWRPKVGEGQVDRTLTSESTAVLDIQEDGVRVAWQSVLQFRRGRREDFSFRLPEGYLVERVTGPNVRGWTTEGDAQGVRLDVELLRAAVDQETISIYLSKRVAFAEGMATPIVAPGIVVADAALHHGQVTVRRSPLVELQATQLGGVTRTDVDAARAEALMNAAGAEERPIPVQPFQAFRFSGVPFDLQFSAQAIRPALSAVTRSIVKVGERETRLETRFELHVDRAPLHVVRIALPPTFELEQISQPEWVVTDEDGARMVTVYLEAGQVGDFAINLLGTLGSRQTTDPVTLPAIRVQGAEKQEGQFAVQIDPAFRVRAENMVNCEVITLEQTQNWLLEEQRALAAGGVTLGYRGFDYAAQLIVARRPPDVRCTTLSNVNITRRAVEETILLEFRVLESGIQQLQFQLPARMAAARLRVPALRQKSITPVEGGDPARPMVRVQLELQDELMDVIRVVVEHDQLLTPDAFAAAIPVVETGTVEQQYVTLQNSGRDEVVTVDTTGLDELTRQQNAWRALADLEITQGFSVRRDATAPRLAVQTRQRQVMQTVDARIGFAETILVVDANGAYRARQQLRVENSTEQYLELELPEGATLWTAQVAGEPVKPTRPPNAANLRVLRLPLVKTEAGDTDYAIHLVYAGRVARLSGLSEVAFPLIRTLNINTELSQVTLYLPESHRWLDFRGASRLGNQAEYAVGYTNYFNEQVAKVSRAFEAGSEYDKARARKSIENLERDYLVQEQQADSGRIVDEQQRVELYSTLERAKQQLGFDVQTEMDGELLDNRAKLNTYYLDQRNYRARNLVINSDGNFKYAPSTTDSKPTGERGDEQEGRFNKEWFSKNNLQLEETIKAGKEAHDQTPPMKGLKMPISEEEGQKAAEEQLRNLNRDVQSRFNRQQAQLEPPASQTAAPEPTTQPANQPAAPQSPAFGGRPGRGRGEQGLAGQQGAMGGLGPTAELPQDNRGGMPSPPGGSPMAGAPGLMGGMGMGGEDRTRMQNGRMAQNGEMGGMGGAGLGGMGGGMGGGGFGLGSAQAADDLAITSEPPVVEGLASLELNLPTRGQVYYFRASRGEVQITGRAVDARLIQRGLRVGLGIVVGGLFLIALRPRRKTTKRRAA